MGKNKFPVGWNNDKVQKVISHYENQNEDEALLEDESFLNNSSESVIQVPNDLIPVIREFIARRENILRLIDHKAKKSVKIAK